MGAQFQLLARSFVHKILADHAGIKKSNYSWKDLFDIVSLFHLIFLMFGMKCLCYLIMVKSGGCRRADFGMVLSPPQVEPWRVKQGAEAVDS